MLEQNFNLKIEDMITYIKSRIHNQLKPSIGLILGSGLGALADELEDHIIIPYTDIPHLPKITAPGHSGNLVIGRLHNKVIFALQGRFHLYEGHKAHWATALVRVMKRLGINTLFLTAAAGGLNRNFQAGDLMLISDHINFSGTSPLVGTNLDDFGPRFPSMFDVYTPCLQKLAIKTAIDNNIYLQQGVYAAILGPNYDTRSELRFLINNNCDAIGMSIVHEAIVAAHCQMQVLGLAAITDMALPDAPRHATQEEVIAASKQISSKFKKLISEILKNMN